MTRSVTSESLACRLNLGSLLDAVAAALETEREVQRRIGGNSAALARSRWDTLEALQAYADALESLAWPIPRQLHQQMELRRALLSRPTAGAGD